MGLNVEFKKLKEYVYTRLNTCTTLNIYNGIVPVNTNYPYLLFSFSSSSMTVRNRTDYILEIDYWNNSNDDTVILEESEKVKQSFNYGWQSESDGFFQSHIEFEAEIPTDNINMSRINQRYLLKVR